MTDFHAGGKAFLQGDRPAVELLGQDVFQRGFHRRDREGIACQGAADAAYICVVDIQSLIESLRHFLRKPIDRGRDASRQRLADGQKIRLQSMSSRVTAGACADGVGLVDDQVCPVHAGQLAQRLVVAGLGMDDADVGHDRLGQHDRHIPGGEGRLQRGDIVELDDLGGVAAGRPAVPCCWPASSACLPRPG